MRKTDKKGYLGISRQGITYIEILTTTLVLAVVVGSSIVVFGKCNVYANEIRQRSVVNNILNEELEELRGMPYNNVLALVDPSTNVGTLVNAGLNDLNNGTCTLTLEAAPFNDNNIRRATLTVSWISPEGRTVTKDLSAYIARIGVSN